MPSLGARQVKSRRLSAVGLASLLLFVVVTVLVRENVTQAFDARLALLINADMGAAFTSLMVLASLYGREYFWIPVLLVMFLFGRPGMKVLAIELGVLFAVGIVAGELSKVVIDRMRPFETISGIVTRVSIDSSSSFPSGHALITSIGASFAIIKFRSRIVALLLTLEAAIVCYSRVYVGMHYPLDVAAGILLGVAITSLGLLVMETVLRRHLGRLTSVLEKVMKPVHLPEVLGTGLPGQIAPASKVRPDHDALGAPGLAETPCTGRLLVDRLLSPRRESASVNCPVRRGRRVFHGERHRSCGLMLRR